MTVSDPDRPSSVYDCIVDQGLMDSVLALQQQHEQQPNQHDGSFQSENDKDNADVVREWVLEAATAIREHGIYVLVTTKAHLPSRVQQLLSDLGEEAGLEWHFELDGISNDQQVVSVARRYCTGAMPKVGKLSRYSRYQP